MALPMRRKSFLSREDLYVRVPDNRVEAMQLTHLSTLIDQELLQADPVGKDCRGCLAGATEWCGAVDGYLITLGWDWVRLHDLAIGILDPLHLRTNLMLIDRQGTDLGSDLTCTRLLAYLPCLGWQNTVRTEISLRPMSLR